MTKKRHFGGCSNVRNLENRATARKNVCIYGKNLGTGGTES